MGMPGRLHGRDLPLEHRVVAGHLPALDDLGVHRVDVGQDQLQLQGVQVVEGVVATHHVVVGERPQHHHDGVDLADAGQEPVAHALARRRPGHQPGDVDELQRGSDHLLGPGHLGQCPQAGIRYLSDPDVGLRGRERVGGDRDGRSGHGVEQRRLAGVGQADETQAFHPGQGNRQARWGFQRAGPASARRRSEGGVPAVPILLHGFAS